MPLNPTGPLTQYRTQIDINEADIAALTSQVNALGIIHTEVMSAPSFVTQEPTATDTPLQLSFGSNQSVPEFDLDALGALTCLVAGQYEIRLRLLFGRTGAPGVSLVYGRALLNGVQLGSSVHAKLNDGNYNAPATFEGVVPFAVNDIFTVEILRSSVGNNSGGVFSEPSPLAGWAASPSALITISRIALG